MVEQTERIGVAKLELLFASCSWLFREQFVQDYGIDAQVEIVKDAYPTGHLIAIQIKTGASYFSESTDTAYIFRTEDKHVDYWKGHSLPVILVLCNPDEDLLLWQSISEKTAVSTGKGWKIEVPKHQILNENSLGEISKLTQPDPYIRKLNKLRLDSHWIRKLYEGHEIFVEFDDWVNKSLPRYQISLISDEGSHSWPMTYSPGMSIEDALAHFIPWADFYTDLDAHREGCVGQWHAECYMTYDKEWGREIFTEEFDEWYVEPEGIVPCSFDGEVESYRLQLSLNELGESFLEVHDFLAEEDRFEGRTFTAEDLLP